MPQLWIGTSGWVYKHWMGPFYPARLPGEDQLPFYAERFPTVEVNFSFYRLPERSVFETWRDQTPPGFLFAVKASRFLTHRELRKAGRFWTRSRDSTRFSCKRGIEDDWQRRGTSRPDRGGGNWLGSAAAPAAWAR
ncbi:MAG: DUF72 domain-containing protein [Chloroflexi bacterium]|nr:DUF72 domain-containing protein [Chloroflexota bacterium]